MTDELRATLEIRVHAYDDAVVASLVELVQQEYVERYGGPDAAEIDPAEFAAPNGLFLVGYLSADGFDGEPVVTGGFRRLPDRPGAAELKRMFTVRTARRRGLARVMLTELERRAAEAGVRQLVLNTGDRQPEAIALYRAEGYVDVPGFGHYLQIPDALFYGKHLSPETTEPA